MNHNNQNTAVSNSADATHKMSGPIHEQLSQNDDTTADQYNAYHNHLNYDYYSNADTDHHWNHYPSPYQYNEYKNDDEDEHEEDRLDGYDELEWDPKSNKMRITTFKADRKAKRKKDPMVQSYQQTMKMIQHINRHHEVSRKQHKRDQNLYGVIIINGKALYLATICNNYCTELLSKSNNFRSGKHNKGGQSAARFGRIYENKINSFVKECASTICKTFHKDSILGQRVHAIIVGGNGTMKDKLHQYLDDEYVKSMIIKVVNTKCGGKDGFDEVFQRLKSKQLFASNEMQQNKRDYNLLQQVMQMAHDENQCDMIAIGVDETLRAIKLNIVKHVVLADGCYQYVIKKKTTPIKFIQSQMELHAVIREMKITVGKTWKIVGFMDYMKNICRIHEVKLQIVSSDSEMSKQFIAEFSGCIGVLHQSFNYLHE